MLKLVENVEKRQKLSKRWKAVDARFNSASLTLEIMRKEAVVESTYSLAIERTFLISLKNKYAGNSQLYEFNKMMYNVIL